MSHQIVGHAVHAGIFKLGQASLTYVSESDFDRSV